ncbi:MAG: NUDIX domain-containing protein [Candidatus Thorarchaeota archaeon]
MSGTLPIVVAIVECGGKFLFIRRRRAPYEGLWSLLGGKMAPGEHPQSATIREVAEESGAAEVADYKYRGVVSERLVSDSGELISHFLIFVSSVRVDGFSEHNREGHLASFARHEIEHNRDEFLPSDWCMFSSFMLHENNGSLYEAELVAQQGRYVLNYYRVVES